MTVYWLQLMVRKNNQLTSFKALFECDLDSIAAMVERLERKGIVYGRRLKVFYQKHGDMLVTGREEFAFGLAGFVSIQPYDKELREAPEADRT